VTRIPTHRGDVLILVTARSFKTHVVGIVERDDQQDFHLPANVKYEVDLAAAVATANALILPGRRIFCRHLDTGEWSEVPQPP
jgi:hypothetical protein